MVLVRLLFLAASRRYRQQRKGFLEFLRFFVSFFATLFGRDRLLIVSAGVGYAFWTGLLSALGALGVALAAFVLLVLQLVLRGRRYVGNSLQPRRSVKKLPEHRDPALLAKACSMPVARLYEPLLFQPQEGYCGQSSLLNLIRSIPTRSHLFQLPARPAPMEAAEVRNMLVALQEFDPALRIKAASFLGPLTLAEFRAQMHDVNNPAVRIVANFLRAPLFFNDPDDAKKVPLLLRLFGGHWSPLGAYLAEEDLVLVLDTNEQYAKYLVPTQRLWEAVTTRQIYDGKHRGLVRVELDLAG